METTIIRKPTSFRLRTDLLEGLKRKAARENRTPGNYVESVLLDIVYDEPNEVTKAAIMEAMNRKEYPAKDLYDDVNELFKALDAEVRKKLFLSSQYKKDYKRYAGVSPAGKRYKKNPQEGRSLERGPQDAPKRTAHPCGV